MDHERGTDTYNLIGGLGKDCSNKNNPDITKGTQREQTSHGPVYMEYPGSSKL